MRHLSSAFIVPIVWYKSLCRQRTTESCIAIRIRRDTDQDVAFDPSRGTEGRAPFNSNIAASYVASDPSRGTVGRAPFNSNIAASYGSNGDKEGVIKPVVMDAEIESFTSDGSNEELLAWQERKATELNKRNEWEEHPFNFDRRQSMERRKRIVHEANAPATVRKERVLSSNAIRRGDFQHDNSFSASRAGSISNNGRRIENNKSVANGKKSSSFVAASTSPTTVNNSGLPSLRIRTSEQKTTQRSDEISIAQVALRNEFRKQTTSMAMQPCFREIEKKAWDESIPITIKGDCLKTWSYRKSFERVLVCLTTDGGGPLDADIQLWQGPDYSPCRIRSFVGNGELRPFNCVVETPGSLNTVAIRNRAHEEYPIKASVISKGVYNPFEEPRKELEESHLEAGGDPRSFPFEDVVNNARVFLKTDGRPLNARVELMQGEKVVQAFEISAEDGKARPFCAVIETPGTDNVIRILNTAAVDFPLQVWAEPCELDERRKRAEAFNKEVVDTHHKTDQGHY